MDRTDTTTGRPRILVRGGTSASLRTVADLREAVEHGHARELWRQVLETAQNAAASEPLTAFTPLDEGMYRIGIARWPKWRLFGFRSDPRGTLDIKLGRLTAPCELRLNYRCEPGGRIRAELLNHDEYTLEQAVALSGDELHAPVAWTDGTVLPATPEGDTVVRLHLDLAEIYAYELTRPKSRTGGSPSH